MRTTGKAITAAAAALLAAALTACGSADAADSHTGPIIMGSLHPTPLGGWSTPPRTSEPRTTEPSYLPDDPTGDDSTYETETPDVPVTPEEEPTEQSSGSTVSGHAYRSDGSPMSGVLIHFRIVPESYGGLYRTSTDGDGAYSAELPAGVYIVLASTPGDPDVSVSLTPRQTGPDGVASVSVPPAHVVDFDEP
jgi:hypothetical protein